MIGAEHCTWKFADFQNSLQERGVVRPFTGKEDVSPSTYGCRITVFYCERIFGHPVLFWLVNEERKDVRGSL